VSDLLSLQKALAEETRLKSLLLMQHVGELCVCDLTTALSLSQPKISRHLAELRRQGLVLDQRRGKWVYYKINPDLDHWMVEVLALTLKHNFSFIEQELKRMTGSHC
jgi:ArsR family transcriptional regulator